MRSPQLGPGLPYGVSLRDLAQAAEGVAVLEQCRLQERRMELLHSLAGEPLGCCAPQRRLNGGGRGSGVGPADAVPRLRRQCLRAQRRGVRVKQLLQGVPVHNPGRQEPQLRRQPAPSIPQRRIVPAVCGRCPAVAGLQLGEARAASRGVAIEQADGRPVGVRLLLGREQIAVHRGPQLPPALVKLQQQGAHLVPLELVGEVAEPQLRGAVAEPALALRGLPCAVPVAAQEPVLRV
mmetsp:Transcript_47344/g.131657  ORF Transcript_47344/g.131657 Transcript_47344/m.131657 type:complete len:236 (-) Transcript_47344:2283-2990(-)